MTPEVSPPATIPPWRKAIPQSRDRLQSKILVGIALPILCYLVADTRFLNFTDHRDLVYLRASVIVSIAFAFFAWRLRAATPLAAFSGGLICFLITEYTGYQEGFNQFGGASVLHSGLSPLILLFVLTFSATHFERENKESIGLQEDKKGRSAAQIIANLGMAGFLSSLLGSELAVTAAGFGSWATERQTFLHFMLMFRMPVVAALAEATADTVSSEIGQAFGGRPILLTTLRRAEPGTDGAITLTGTLAGIAAALLIAATGAPALGMNLAECSVVFAAAVFGLFFDSLLGATVERKGWLGNDLVNFLSTAASAGVALLAIRLWQEYLLR